MTGRDYLWCALNMLLDDEEALNALCPACRAEAQSGRCPVCGGIVTDHGENDSFDQTRFEQLQRGEAR